MYPFNLPIHRGPFTLKIKYLNLHTTGLIVHSVHSFIRSFVHSFIRSFVHTFIRPYLHLIHASRIVRTREGRREASGEVLYVHLVDFLARGYGEEEAEDKAKHVLLRLPYP